MLKENIKVILAAFAGFIIANAFLLGGLRGRIDNLQHDIDNLQHSVNNMYSEMNYINSNINDTLDTVKKSTNLIANYSTSVDINDKNEVELSLELTPNNINLETDSLYVVCKADDENVKLEMKKTDEYKYIAGGVLPLCNDIELNLIVKSSDGTVRSESMDYLNIMDMLSYECNFDYSIQRGNVTVDTPTILELYSNYDMTIDEDTFQLIEAVVYDESGKECTRTKLSYSKQDSLAENMAVYTGGYVFSGKVDKYYEVYIEAKSKNGLSYREQVGSFTDYSSGECGSFQLVPEI